VYEAEYDKKTLGECVRESVGVEMNAVKEALARFLNDADPDDRHIWF